MTNPLSKTRLKGFTIDAHSARARRGECPGLNQYSRLHKGTVAFPKPFHVQTPAQTKKRAAGSRSQICHKTFRRSIAGYSRIMPSLYLGERKNVFWPKELAFPSQNLYIKMCWLCQPVSNSTTSTSANGPCLLQIGTSRPSSSKTKKKKIQKIPIFEKNVC